MSKKKKPLESGLKDSESLSFRKGEMFFIPFGKRLLAWIYGNYIWDNNVTYIGVLWFLLALFWSEIFFYLTNKMSGKSIILISVFVCIGLFCSAINVFIKARLPWCLDIACISFLFLFVGAWYKNNIKTTNLLLSVCLIILGGVIGAANCWLMKMLGFHMTRVDMLYMNYGVFPLFFISTSMISVGFMMICQIIYEKIDFQFIEHLGRISLLIMVIHLYIIQMVGYYTNNWILKMLVACIGSIVLGLLIERFAPWLYRFSFVMRKRLNQ